LPVARLERQNSVFALRRLQYAGHISFGS